MNVGIIIMFALPALALALASAISPTLASPQPRAAEHTLPCSLAVNGTLQIVTAEPLTRTGATFVGNQYDVNGELAQFLKVFAIQDGQNYEFDFYTCNSTFMGYAQSPSEYGLTYLYGQLRDHYTGLCVTGTSLGDYVSSTFSAQSCSTRDDATQLRQFFRFLAQPATVGSVGAGLDPNPELMFIGVPQSDDGDGGDRYTFAYSTDDDYEGGSDYYPTITATNPRTSDSSLAFYAPTYHY